jgi:hypothetical protein
MEYNDINSMLSGLEIVNKETEKDEKIEPVTLEEKTKINNILCFRDINHKKNLEVANTHDIKQTDTGEDRDINKQINSRMFDLHKTYKPTPLMEFYPQSSRNNNKKPPSS